MEDLQPLGFLTATELLNSGLFIHTKLSSTLQTGHNLGASGATSKILLPSFQDLFWKSYQRWDLFLAPTV